MKLLVIPDIHCRTFWKEAVEKYKDEVDRIIFLGDYLDPYPWECATDGITRKSGIKNFEEIIEFKSQNKDKVILLLGNHDLAYWNKRFNPKIRFDSSHAYHITQDFLSHKSLFQLAHEETINDKRYLFTHAGVMMPWYEHYKDLIGELTADNLNKLKDFGGGIEALSQLSRFRGGWEWIGSIVWSDIDERKIANGDFDGIYQVFGHSQQEKHPVITPTWACLDCRKAFILDDSGGFTEV